MAYSTSNPPVMNPQPIAGPRTWEYRSTDPSTVVRVSGYITNGQLLGMKAGDQVRVVDTNASPIAATMHTVSSLSTSDDSVDLSNGVDIGTTDAD